MTDETDDVTEDECTDSETEGEESYGPLGPRMVGKVATVKVAYTYEREVPVLMPVDGDPGEQADMKLYLEGEFDDLVGERDLIHSEIVEEEPVYEDEFDSPDEWPSYV